MGNSVCRTKIFLLRWISGRCLSIDCRYILMKMIDTMNSGQPRKRKGRKAFKDWKLNLTVGGQNYKISHVYTEKNGYVHIRVCRNWLLISSENSLELEVDKYFLKREIEREREEGLDFLQILMLLLISPIIRYDHRIVNNVLQLFSLFINLSYTMK